MMRAEIVAGLSRPLKEIPSKYFYDERGSRLFEAITRTPEYYPTRTEATLLRGHVAGWLAATGPNALVELGAGNAEKTRIILDALLAKARESPCPASEVGAVRAERSAARAAYAPVDVSTDFLQGTAVTLRGEYPTLDVYPVVGDFNRPLQVPAVVPRPRWVAFLGSTLGNLDHDQARALLRRVAQTLGPEDRFLLGTDLQPGPCKSVSRLELAYNDAQGLTAAFNRNVLSVLNRALGADFDPTAYDHLAFYNEEEGRIEMHLVTRFAQQVRIPPDTEIVLRAGESIRTEISCKYTRPLVEDLLASAGLSMEEWVQDDEGLFALSLARVRTPGREAAS